MAFRRSNLSPVELSVIDLDLVILLFSLIPSSGQFFLINMKTEERNLRGRQTPFSNNAREKVWIRE